MSIADNATFTAGGQGYQPGGRFLPDLSRRGYFSTKSSRAKRFCERFFTSGSGFNSSDSGSSLARLSSRWCSSMPYKSCLRCSAKISVMDLYFLFMLLPCKAMRRSTSHHGADSDYSDSLALRRWRRLISPSSAETINCPVLSPSSFKFSTASAIAWGTRASSFLDFPLTAFVAISDFLVIRWLTVYTQENGKTLLTWLTPVTSIVADTFVEVIDEKTKPAGATNTNGLLTANDSESIEVAMRNHITHPQGRDSHNLNKYIWRFIALSTAQPRVITIEATSEQEARQQSPAGCVMVFAARIRQGVFHA
ncbi:host cell division inhibitor Icd-like protein [Escherichia coli]|nr:host cell division inhibitor Icd-like protein [Escherichia coli]EJD9575644.1 host cell division inhibitor Icd-like protein [Escherichia coli]HBN7021005.1 host cell division inhibitor Icd-like protein [Escherichia coli]HCP7428348.1 host cell division inhibitor Icd-like protein [Escherichia coli]HDW4018426.1 host cell division inhibitor Icd-like protein [Escherichia coli]